MELLFILKKIPLLFPLIRDFPGGLGSKQSTYNARKLGLIPGLGRSSGAGNGYPLQDSCLENPMDRGAWWATGYSCKRLDISELLACPVISLEHSRALEISLQCLFHSVSYSFMVWWEVFGTVIEILSQSDCLHSNSNSPPVSCMTLGNSLHSSRCNWSHL